MVVSAVVEDGAGHVVPYARLLVSGTNKATGDENGFAYRSRVIAFPIVRIHKGSAATLSSGLPVTASARGVVSLTVEDTNAVTDHYTFWPVANGAVSSVRPLAIDKTKGSSLAISWDASSGLSGIATYPLLPSAVRANDPNLSSGVQTEEGQIATVYFAPVNRRGPVTGSSFVYSLRATNGSDISTIDGVDLLIPAAQVTLTVRYAKGQYVLSVPGGFLDSSTPVAHVSPTVTITAGGADTYDPSIQSIQQSAPMPGSDAGFDPELFSVGVMGQAAGTVNITAASGRVSATQSVSIQAGLPNAVATANPVSGYIESGQPLTVKLTVVDAAGNPVPEAAVPVTVEGSLSPLWVTQVNGVSLTSGVGAAQQPTPIPLYVPFGWGGVGTAVFGPYTTVLIPGVVNDNQIGSSNPPQFTVYTDAQGQVSLTLQNNNVTYYDQPTAPYTVTSQVISNAGNVYIGSTGDAVGQNFMIVLSGQPLASGQAAQVAYAASAASVGG